MVSHLTSDLSMGILITTYIDHHDKTKRANYWKRHLVANRTELHLITNLVPSPELFSAMLLWGDSILQV